MAKTCAGTNKDGSSCSNKAMEGGRYCHIHQGQGQSTSGSTGSDDEQDASRRLRTAIAFTLVWIAILVLGAYIGSLR